MKKWKCPACGLVWLYEKGTKPDRDDCPGCKPQGEVGELTEHPPGCTCRADGKGCAKEDLE